MRLALRLAALGLLPLLLSPAWSQELGGRSLPAAVVKVLSGDNINVFVNGDVERVHYIGVTAPDPGGGDREGEPLGKEALRFNRGLVQARNVRIELDVQERDADGRLLAYVWLGDVMANAEVIGHGFGEVVTGGPNVRHQEMLLQRQQEARAAHLGIWRTAGPAPPAPRSAPGAPEPRTAQARPGVPPRNAWSCPLGQPIKGNFRTYSSERCIYYPPGTQTYAETHPDRCYASEEEARRDGCRRSRR